MEIATTTDDDDNFPRVPQSHHNRYYMRIALSIRVPLRVLFHKGTIPGTETGTLI